MRYRFSRKITFLQNVFIVDILFIYLMINTRTIRDIPRTYRFVANYWKYSNPRGYSVQLIWVIWCKLTIDWATIYLLVCFAKCQMNTQFINDAIHHKIKSKSKLIVDFIYCTVTMKWGWTWLNTRELVDCQTHTHTINSYTMQCYNFFFQFMIENFHLS